MDNDELAYRIHGLDYSDSDSDQEGKDDFDEEYYLFKPPPLKYEDIKDKIIHISPKIPVIVNVWEERKKKMLQSKANEQSNVNETVNNETNGLNQICISSVQDTPKENYKESDVTNSSGVVAKKSKKKNKKQLTDEYKLYSLDQESSENYEEEVVTNTKSGVVAKKSKNKKKKKEIIDNSKFNSLVQGSSDQSIQNNEEETENVAEKVLYSKMVKKKDKNIEIPHNPVGAIISENKVHDYNGSHVLPEKINESNIMNITTTVKLPICNEKINPSSKKRFVPSVHLNDVQLWKINKTLDTLLPNSLRRTDLSNAQEELEYFKNRDRELYSYWYDTLKSVKPTIKNSNFIGNKDNERLEECNESEDGLDSLTRDEDKQEKCFNYQSKIYHIDNVKPGRQNVLKTISESDMMESKDGCLYLGNTLNQADILNEAEDILGYKDDLAAKPKKKRVRGKKKKSSSSSDETKLFEGKEQNDSTLKEVILTTDTDNDKKDSSLIYFPVECTEENDVYRRKMAKLQLDKLRNENIFYCECDGKYHFKALGDLAAERVVDDKTSKSDEYNMKPPDILALERVADDENNKSDENNSKIITKVQLNDELKNETKLFYYEFLGTNFQHFLDFRETYLFKSLGNKENRSALVAESAHDESMTNEVQLKNELSETKIFYYDFQGRNLQCFLNFRETYLFKSLDALAAERVARDESMSNEVRLKNELSETKIFYYDFQGRNLQRFLHFRETYLFKSLDVLAAERVARDESMTNEVELKNELSETKSFYYDFQGRNLQRFLNFREAYLFQSVDALANKEVPNNGKPKKTGIENIPSQENNAPDTKLNVKYRIITKILYLVCLAIVMHFVITTLFKIHIFVKDNFIQIILTLVSVMILYILNVK